MNDKQQLIWDKINKTSFIYQKNMDLLTRKKVGAYYTDLFFTDVLVNELFKNMDESFKKNIYLKTFFEPCVGTGNFVFSYLKFIHDNLKLNKKQIDQLISNIFVSDSDKKSLEIFISLLNEFVGVFFETKLTDDYIKNNVGNALIFDIEKKQDKLINPIDYFEVEKFDIIMTNPPYKGFRAEKKHYTKTKDYEKDKKHYKELKELIKKNFSYQGKGSPNLYKLFTEEILTKYAKPQSFVYLLIPQSILKDQSSTDLRNFILDKMKIIHIYNIDERSNYVDANQALSAVLIKKIKKTEIFHVIEHYGNSQECEYLVDIKDVKNNINSSIIALSRKDKLLLQKMNAFPKISEYEYINNFRGELDITVNKNSIVSKSQYKLIRGRNLTLFNLKNLESTDYVCPEFVSKCSKNRYINLERIACPQISNMNAKKRLFFSYIPSGFVLGNSCNFIQVLKNEEGMDIFFLLALLNSELYDWYFKMFSSNNHINNYEIDNFPIPNVSMENKQELSLLAKSYIENPSEFILAKINRLVNKLIEGDYDQSMNDIDEFFLRDIQAAFPQLDLKSIQNFINDEKKLTELFVTGNLTQFDRKVFNGIVEKYRLLNLGEVLNHSSFKLSDLDMEMVKSILPGGNWKQIPLEVAQKSKRLMKIRETGGRTTLYGRLNYEKPSFTITTYFNRPGNGTNIHPIHDRVLSVREAARIQGFSDEYFFYGNKKNKLNQIGNAVPPFMAYQIAKKIKEQTGLKTSLDLFNGAGGMTTGFKLAGFHSVMMNDIDEAALVTAKINYPASAAYLGDLTKEVNRSFIIDYAKKAKVDIVNGGPPCQGFSMAGFRNIDDPRSKLIYDYVEVLKKVCPKLFVFENVQGLLSHNNGETFKELLSMFSEIGYKVEAKLLDFSDFGIPQKRKRVIIIGVKKGIDICPKDLFPSPTTMDKLDKILVKDAISDLENVPLDNKSYYDDSPKSKYVKILQNLKTVDSDLTKLKKTTTNISIEKKPFQLSFFDI
ncbi:hypothetical protein BFR38_03170 [Brochothrix thermosphacta]|uniref:Alw26I/Eco31I/Esp3I family type II restriction adenine-specific DNA-methyltransferase n=1 Tax=Brochothrix thermosphacta TaxID=2756 RepID=UPI00083FD643|nr:Alw26I/Eco31I/Esp3I family type II restriction adenine-specific DNA-methyltransferase [Brochothrix thermosphacta]ODJ51997.1 hypothetical protein BFR38_03170 [Brochothrix thermosphacta]